MDCELARGAKRLQKYVNTAWWENRSDIFSKRRKICMTQWFSRCDDDLHTKFFFIKQSWVSNSWLSMGRTKPCKALSRPCHHCAGMSSAMSLMQYMYTGTLHKVKLARESWNLLKLCTNFCIPCNVTLGNIYRMMPSHFSQRRSRRLMQRRNLTSTKIATRANWHWGNYTMWVIESLWCCIHPRPVVLVEHWSQSSAKWLMSMTSRCSCSPLYSTHHVHCSCCTVWSKA